MIFDVLKGYLVSEHPNTDIHCLLKNNISLMTAKLFGFLALTFGEYSKFLTNLALDSTQNTSLLFGPPGLRPGSD
jgi:hypothetical protein